MDLGRADVDQSGDLEARKSRQAGAAGDVRQCRGLLSLGLDRGRRRARNHFPDPAGGARPALDHRRRAGAGVLLLDAACDRLFLADPDLHRLLHDLPARDRRPALQRRHGADFLHPVRRGGDADRRASSVCRSAGRRRLQVHAFGVHRAGGAADAADGVHDLRLGRDRQPAARRPRRVRMGQRAALAKSDHAGDRAVAGHARLRRRRRADQHELSARCQRPQHAMDHRAFPPDLRRRHRDHVFRDRL